MSTIEVTTVQASELHPNLDNPRKAVDPAALSELVRSIQANGIITPLVVSPHADSKGDSDGYVILAGHRRFMAAAEAGVEEIPVRILHGQYDERAVLLADNVIREDLSPLDEARAYQAMLDSGMTVDRVSKAVGKKRITIAARLELLGLPQLAVSAIEEKTLQIGAAQLLADIAQQDVVLAEEITGRIMGDAEKQRRFLRSPADVADEALEQDPGEHPAPVAYAAGHQGPVVWNEKTIHAKLDCVIAKLGEHGEKVRAALNPHEWEEPSQSGYDRYGHDLFRQCFVLDDDEVDAARAYGCVLALESTEQGWGEDVEVVPYICDAEWLAQRIVANLGDFVGKPEGRQKAAAAPKTEEGKPDTEKQAAAEKQRAEEREASYQLGQARRRANLALGVALAKWQPPVDADAIKLLGRVILEGMASSGGVGLDSSASKALMLLEEHEIKTSANGREKVVYPRDPEVLKQRRDALLTRLDKAKTPEEALAIIMRALVANQLVMTESMASADGGGVHQPYRLRDDAGMQKIARRVAPPAMKKQIKAEEDLRAAEHTRREDEWKAARARVKKAAEAREKASQAAETPDPESASDQDASPEGE